MSTEIKNNYYEVLEVSTSATQHDIVVAYEKAKRTYSSENPALFNVFSEQEATALRALIDEAFSVLGNQTYRNIYEKRVQAKTYTDHELSLVAIQKASENLYASRITVPATEAVIAKEESFSVDSAFESEITEQAEWNGLFLQKVREYKKVSLDALHEKTKVNPWYLKALENMDPANLPAPVFVRGYIVQMAKSLGLNDKTVADSYMKLYKQKLEQPK
jgi:curved DNA-binding protein CbpA